MKNYKSNVLQATFIVVATIGISSCMNNKTVDSKEIAEEKNERKMNSYSNEEDAEFLVDAAEINLIEISLGKLAQEKGNNEHVKELGKMMVDEHTQLLADLTALAKTKNISLPTSQTEDGQEDYNELNQESGKDFGKKYSEMMVDEHKDAIELFEKASTECTDPDIRAWATKTLPLLRSHLEQSIMCQKACAKN